MSIELFIIADDLTGALDTGVKFSERGISSYVIPSFLPGLFDSKIDVQVLIVNSESRHLSPEDAYNRVFQAASEAIAYGVPHIYKKTDSALRGNIGAELSALLDASRENILPFLPAYPLMNRVTKGGEHFIDGVLVSGSPFGKDPFDPVTESYLPDLLAAQCAAPVAVCAPGFIPVPVDDRPVIAVFDAETDLDLRLSGEALSRGSFKISAGCAGFATALPDLLHIAPKALTTPPISAFTLYTCGSISPITIEQIKTAQKAGIPVFEADDGIISDGFVSSDAGRALVSGIVSVLEREGRAVLASVVHEETLERRRAFEASGNASDARVNISRNLGSLTRAAADRVGSMNFVIFGGDTLSEVMRASDMQGLTPVRELFPGVVLAEASGAAGSFTIVTKSGGFGGSDIVIQIDACLNKLTSL